MGLILLSMVLGWVSLSLVAGGIGQWVWMSDHRADFWGRLFGGLLVAAGLAIVLLLVLAWRRHLGNVPKSRDHREADPFDRSDLSAIAHRPHPSDRPAP
ncbi:hypothetical protein [Alienimonas chondri]|uniref:hypothetical protein n=1 Tax=Alienimonas chondri TaxID=2681879 RepID=UPI00148767CC|nr:hypothetical protein [Alienimonas chondri]